jgi:predicted N-acetyltransferase YhbS
MRHLHLGPVCVDPELQGKGIGRTLLNHYCEELDQLKLSGYIETDRPEYVDIYEKFNFQTVSTSLVQGSKTSEGGGTAITLTQTKLPEDLVPCHIKGWESALQHMQISFIGENI